MQIDRIDHLVLTVADIERSARFYADALAMAVIQTDGRTALRFGHQKLNLHPAGREYEPKAAKPTPGATDLCFITTTPVALVMEELVAKRIPLVEGPVERMGAIHPLLSVYIRDPDGNLIEIANEIAEPA
ncbi:MAG: VOC family protein [Rhodospirillales bacterium]